jgi:hypothetical protein
MIKRYTAAGLPLDASEPLANAYWCRSDDVQAVENECDRLRLVASVANDKARHFHDAWIQAGARRDRLEAVIESLVALDAQSFDLQTTDIRATLAAVLKGNL